MPTFVDGYGGDVQTANDCWLFADAATTNYGSNTNLDVQGEGTPYTIHPLVKFDLSSLAGMTIVSATLTLVKRGAGGSDMTIAVHRILSANAAWTEAGATWNTRDGTNAWAGSAGCSTSGTDYAAAAMGSFDYVAANAAGTEYNITLDLTEFGSMIANNAGLIVRCATGWTQGFFGSSDHLTTAYHPKLTVEYTAGGGGTAYAGTAVMSRAQAITADDTGLWATALTMSRAQDITLSTTGPWSTVLTLSRAQAIAVVGASTPTVLPQNLLYDAGALFETFEAATDWTGGTPTNNTTQFTEGSQAVLFAGEPSDKTVSLDLTGQLDCIEYDVYNPGGQATQSLFLASNAWGAYVNTYEVVQTGWTRYRATSAIFQSEGSLNEASIVQLRTRATGMTMDNAKAGISAQPALMITFDDALDTVYDNAFPILQAAGIRATMYVTSDFVGTVGYCTWDELGEMYAAGWDLGNHSKTHAHLDTLTQAEVETELDACRDELISRGYTRAAEHVAYPHGGTNATVEAAMAAQGMLTGRTIVNRWMTLPIDGTIEHNYRIPGSFISFTTAIADDAVSHAAIGIPCFHGVEVADISAFQAMIDADVDSGVPNITISQFYRLQSGEVNINEAIGAIYANTTTLSRGLGVAATATGDFTPDAVLSRALLFASSGGYTFADAITLAAALGISVDSVVTKDEYLTFGRAASVAAASGLSAEAAVSLLRGAGVTAESVASYVLALDLGRGQTVAVTGTATIAQALTLARTLAAAASSTHTEAGAVVPISLTLNTRSLSLTLSARSLNLTLGERPD